MGEEERKKEESTPFKPDLEDNPRSHLIQQQQQQQQQYRSPSFSFSNSESWNRILEKEKP